MAHETTVRRRSGSPPRGWSRECPPGNPACRQLAAPPWISARS